MAKLFIPYIYFGNNFIENADILDEIVDIIEIEVALNTFIDEVQL